ncbi:MAG TPA: ABC transporter permease [Vicinamibacterales bacterium]|nr:ABC transporter permease [Vicinamibacterales bacterium]
MPWLRRLVNVFRSRRVDRDIQREVDFHINERADQLHTEGMPLAQARETARRHFGNTLRIREDSRRINSIGWLELLFQEFRFAMRVFRKSPAFAATAVLTLGLGIGATAAVFSVVDAVLIRPLPYPDPDRLIGIWHSAQFQAVTSRNVRLSSTMYLTYREHNRTFAEFGLWRPGAATVTGAGDPEQVRTIVVTHETLPALGVTPAIGRWFSAADDRYGTNETVMLTDGYWRRRFGGDAGIIGRAVTIDARPREVIGIMPRTFRFPIAGLAGVLNADADVILPQRFEPAQLLPNDVHTYIGIARLKPGVSLEQATVDVARMLPLWIAERGTSSAVLTAARFGPALRRVKEDVVGDVGSVLWVLMGTIGLVLLIACANVANLLLVRAEGRRQELTVRAALGAGWRHIARHLLAESVVLGVAGGALGLGLAYAGLQLLIAIGPVNVPRLSEISIDGRVLAFTLGMSVASAVLFGLIPALKFARPGRNMALGTVSGSRNIGDSPTRQRTQHALVIVQVGLAVVLLVASGLMIRTFLALRNVEPGFAVPSQVQTMRLSISQPEVPDPERVVRMQQDILNGLAGLPSVAAVSFATALPMESEFETSMAVTAEGEPVTQGIPPMRRSKNVAPGFFATLGIRLIAGRDFTWTDVVDRRPVVILSASMARDVWGDPAAAIGKRVRVGRGGPWNEVIGVAGDIHDSGVDQAPPAIVYWRAGIQGALSANGPTFTPRDVTFAIRSSRTGTEAFIRQLAQAIWATNPNLPLARVQTMGEIYDRSMARASFALVMLAIAGVMALTLGMVGVYGVISYAVSRRRREIGVRLALGAARTGILRQFLGQSIRVSAVACLCGVVLSLAVTRVLSGLLYGVSPVDTTTMAGVVVVVLLVATLAAMIPATRAALIQPMRTLREE